MVVLGHMPGTSFQFLVVELNWSLLCATCLFIQSKYAYSEANLIKLLVCIQLKKTVKHHIENLVILMELAHKEIIWKRSKHSERRGRAGKTKGLNLKVISCQCHFTLPTHFC